MNLLKAFLPPVLIALIFSVIIFIPQDTKLKDSAISPDLPLGYSVSGWYGERMQESAQERGALSADTLFSKASYNPIGRSTPTPPVEASIVYSGSDMNASIHRPERCLPAQGHLNLLSREEDIKLADGHIMRFTRLASTSNPPALKDKPVKSINHINYYVFIGHECVRSNHLSRTLRDMLDRVLKGYVQRWAYVQIGSYWGDAIGVSEEQCEAAIKEVLSQVIPATLDRTKIKD